MLPPYFLVHNLVWAHARGLARRHQRYKHFVQYSRSSVLQRLLKKTGNNPPPPLHPSLSRCSGSGPRQKEPSIFSTSFTIWCVVYCQVWNGAKNACTSFNSPRRCRGVPFHHRNPGDYDGDLGCTLILFLMPRQSEAAHVIKKGLKKQRQQP